jgi:glycosyltransferase involved in cell wall biosynthesis
VLCAFDAGSTIRAAIESVLSQTHPTWRMIVVDDGSTDGTGEIVREYARSDSRLMLLSQANAGLAASRSRGIREARTEWIARLDADDRYLPVFLESLLAATVTRPGFDVYVPNGWRVHEDGQRVPVYGGSAGALAREITLAEMLVANRVFGMCIFRRQAATDAGLPCQGRVVEDYDLWLQMMTHGSRILYVPKVIAEYRVSDAAMSADRARVAGDVVELLQTIRRSDVLTRSESEIAGRSIRRWGGTRDRAEFERRLLAGEGRRLLGWYLRAWWGFERLPLRVLGLATLVVSPSALRAILSRRRAKSL